MYNGKISPTQARALDSAYDSRHTLISNQITTTPDNRSVWFDLDDLQGFIDDAKSAHGSMNGVRVYLGAESDRGLSTVFMVPTESSNGRNNDIPGADGLNSGDPGDPPSANYPQ